MITPLEPVREAGLPHPESLREGVVVLTEVVGIAIIICDNNNQHQTANALVLLSHKGLLQSEYFLFLNLPHNKIFS